MNNNAYWQGYAEAALQRGVDPQVLVKEARGGGGFGGGGGGESGIMESLASLPPEVIASLLGGGLGAGVGWGLGGGEGALIGGLGGASLGYVGTRGAQALMGGSGRSVEPRFDDPRKAESLLASQGYRDRMAEMRMRAAMSNKAPNPAGYGYEHDQGAVPGYPGYVPGPPPSVAPGDRGGGILDQPGGWGVE